MGHFEYQVNTFGAGLEVRFVSSGLTQQTSGSSKSRTWRSPRLGFTEAQTLAGNRRKMSVVMLAAAASRLDCISSILSRLTTCSTVVQSLLREIHFFKSTVFGVAINIYLAGGDC